MMRPPLRVWAKIVAILDVAAIFALAALMPLSMFGWTAVICFVVHTCAVTAIDAIAIADGYRTAHPDAPQSNATLVLETFAALAARNTLCRIGRHATRDTQPGQCWRCGRADSSADTNSTADWPTFVASMKDGSAQTVRACNEAHARTLVVYGTAATLAAPRNPHQEQFAHGGDAEPLAAVRLHPSNIISVHPIAPTGAHVHG